MKTDNSHRKPTTEREIRMVELLRLAVQARRELAEQVSNLEEMLAEDDPDGMYFDSLHELCDGLCHCEPHEMHPEMLLNEIDKLR